LTKSCLRVVTRAFRGSGGGPAGRDDVARIEQRHVQRLREPRVVEPRLASPDGVLIAAEVLEALRNRPTIKLLNGCGRAGMAERMQPPLRRAGFDVLDTGNADRFDYEQTVVRDRSGKAGAATKLSDWLQAEYGVGEVRDDRVPVPEADLILILGRDLADSLARGESRAR
jgi:hypothetical protein